MIKTKFNIQRIDAIDLSIALYTGIFAYDSDGVVSPYEAFVWCSGVIFRTCEAFA
ncbi:hypothetical protein QQ008_22760 [Fulvivirgaceae bacterium BMA10]|uniref:Uncharacterized protein n=1 Tax=Splendidivirga corallicola TaxID=3051826 RepID=A0ABT8KTX6_9BACT|nr:hypothetical protein [Fulvivirgaceae bacterium BMA10]